MKIPIPDNPPRRYDEDDPLNPARGIICAVLLSSFVWIAIYLVYRYASAAGEVVTLLDEVTR